MHQPMYLWFLGALKVNVNFCKISFYSILFFFYFLLNRPTKEKLYGYFRISSRRSVTTSEHQQPVESEVSTTVENTTTTCTTDKTEEMVQTADNNIVVECDKINASKSFRKSMRGSKKHIQATAAAVSDHKHRMSVDSISLNKIDAFDPLLNSCSNITTSTYCNIGLGENIDSTFTEKVLLWNNDHIPNDAYSAGRKPSVSDVASRRESSSTYECDLDAIDLLERERDGDPIRSISRQNSSIRRYHRKLPNIPPPPLIINENSSAQTENKKTVAHESVQQEFYHPLHRKVSYPMSFSKQNSTKSLISDSNSHYHTHLHRTRSNGSASTTKSSMKSRRINNPELV